MNNLTHSVDLLENNLAKLLGRFKSLKQFNQELLAEKGELLKKISLQEQVISDLEGQIASTKIANAIVGSKEDKHLTKLKINNLVREIDWCIAQLSD
ncbi:MAG: hypothetical protein U5K51_14785 [Flavobacteriaceae bacterium]|nr:hypothetical protein [Flavobacteriaceae bacterium]